MSCVTSSILAPSSSGLHLPGSFSSSHNIQEKELVVENSFPVGPQWDCLVIRFVSLGGESETRDVHERCPNLKSQGISRSLSSDMQRHDDITVTWGHGLTEKEGRSPVGSLGL